MYQLDNSDRWVLTFGDRGARSKAIWNQPNPDTGTSVVVADIRRLITELKPQVDGPFPVPVETWPTAKLAKYCDTQYRTFTEPHRCGLEMPEIAVFQRDHPKTRRGQTYVFRATNGRNRISIANYLGARFIPIEVSSEYVRPAAEFLGCRSWYRYVFK